MKNQIENEQKNAKLSAMRERLDDLIEQSRNITFGFRHFMDTCQHLIETLFIDQINRIIEKGKYVAPESSKD